jgi:hypothetical protein
LQRMDEPVDSKSAMPGPFERVGALVQLLTTLDMRLVAAMDSIDEMRGALASLESLGAGGEDLVADLRESSARLEARINRDLDEIKEAVLAKLGDLDVDGIGVRLDRLEQAIFNIERATVHLDESFIAALESLPDFMSKRVKAGGPKGPPAEAAGPAPIDKEPPVS